MKVFLTGATGVAGRLADLEDRVLSQALQRQATGDVVVSEAEVDQALKENDKDRLQPRRVQLGRERQQRGRPGMRDPPGRVFRGKGPNVADDPAHLRLGEVHSRRRVAAEPAVLQAVARELEIAEVRHQIAPARSSWRA